MPKVSFRLKLRTLLRVLGPSVHFHSPSFIPQTFQPLLAVSSGVRTRASGLIRQVLCNGTLDNFRGGTEKGRAEGAGKEGVTGGDI